MRSETEVEKKGYFKKIQQLHRYEEKKDFS